MLDETIYKNENYWSKKADGVISLFNADKYTGGKNPGIGTCFQIH